MSSEQKNFLGLAPMAQVMLIGGVLVTILCVGCLAFSVIASILSPDTPSSQSAAIERPTAPPVVFSEPTAEPTQPPPAPEPEQPPAEPAPPEPPAEPTATPAPQGPQMGEMGQPIESGGVTLTVDELRLDGQLAHVLVRLVNTQSEGEISYNWAEFTLRSVDGFDFEFAVFQVLEPDLDSGQLLPGEAAAGWIAFRDVIEGSELILVYERSFNFGTFEPIRVRLN